MLVLVIPQTYTSSVLFVFNLRLHIIPDVIRGLFSNELGPWGSQEIQYLFGFPVPW